MADRSDAPAPPPPHIQSVDQIFTWLAEAVHTGQVPQEATDTYDADEATQPEGPPPPQPVSAPPQPSADHRQPPDLQAEYRWLQEERKRLEAYTLSQFALIKQQREELLGRKSQIEEALALREQELNRQLKIVADSTDALHKRGKETAEREAALAVHLEQLQTAQQTVQTFQQTSGKLQKDIDAQRTQLEQTRIQNAHLQEAARVARSELAALDNTQKNRKRAWEEQEAELAARRTQLEERFTALEQAEESVRRRLAELDQLEAHLPREFEQREQQLQSEYQKLALRRHELNEQQKQTTDRLEASQRHEQEMAEREARLAEREAKLSDVQQDVLTLREMQAQLRQETEDRQQSLDQARTLTAQQEEAVRGRRAQLAALENELRQQQQARQQLEQDLAARQDELQRCGLAVQDIEQTLKQRGEELDRRESEQNTRMKEREQQLKAEEARLRDAAIRRLQELEQQRKRQADQTEQQRQRLADEAEVYRKGLAQETEQHQQRMAQQAEALQQRTTELDAREARHAAQLERLKNADEELAKLQQTVETVRAEAEVQRRLFEQLTEQNKQLQEAAEAAHNDLSILERTRQERKQAWRKEEKEWTAKRQQAEMAEESLRRRVAELDEVWAEMQRQLDARKRQVAQAEKKVMETLVVREQELKQGYKAQEDELAARCKKLEVAEQALRRRVAELDEVWNRMHEQLETREHQLTQEYQRLEKDKKRSRLLNN